MAIPVKLCKKEDNEARDKRQETSSTVMCTGDEYRGKHTNENMRQTAWRGIGY